MFSSKLLFVMISSLISEFLEVFFISKYISIFVLQQFHSRRSTYFVWWGTYSLKLVEDYLAFGSPVPFKYCSYVPEKNGNSCFRSRVLCMPSKSSLLYSLSSSFCVVLPKNNTERYVETSHMVVSVFFSLWFWYITCACMHACVYVCVRACVCVIFKLFYKVPQVLNILVFLCWIFYQVGHPFFNLY